MYIYCMLQFPNKEVRWCPHFRCILLYVAGTVPSMHHDLDEISKVSLFERLVLCSSSYN